MDAACPRRRRPLRWRARGRESRDLRRCAAWQAAWQAARLCSEQRLLFKRTLFKRTLLKRTAPGSSSGQQKGPTVHPNNILGPAIRAAARAGVRVEERRPQAAARRT